MARFSDEVMRAKKSARRLGEPSGASFMVGPAGDTDNQPISTIAAPMPMTRIWVARRDSQDNHDEISYSRAVVTAAF